MNRTFRSADRFIQNEITNFTIEITQKCNFRCSYCCFSGEYAHMRSHSSRSMSKDIILKSIDFIENNAHNEERISVSFFGGEALLGIKSILFIMKELNNFFGERICFDISTNGYILSPHIVDALLNYNVGVSVSLDGCKVIHDKNRRTINGSPTYDIIVSNLKNFKLRHPSEYNKRVRILITSGFLHEIKLMNEYYSELCELIGEKPLFISHIYPNFKNGVVYDDSVSEIMDFYRIAIEKRKNGISDLYTILLDDIMKKSKKKFVCNETANRINLRTCLDCLYSAFIDIDGNISPCEKFDSKHHIGDVTNGIDIRLLKKWSYIYSLRRTFLCGKCEIVEFCSRCLADLKMTSAEQRLMCEIYKKNVQVAINIKEKLN